MNESSFSLISIFREIFKKKIFILLLALAAGIVSFIFCKLQEVRYTSQTSFIVKSPLLIDRNFVFRNTSFENKEFFAIPDDVDQVRSIAGSDATLWFIIKKFDLAKAYNITNEDVLLKRVKKSFKIVMDDTRTVQVSFTDPDPKRAADITNALRDHIEEMFMDFFTRTNKDIVGALKEKSISINDTIARLDDSIQAIRASVNNYNQVLPSRGNTVVTTGSNGTAQSAAAMEHIHELATVKDKLVGDVASFRSLINEYEVMSGGKIHIFYMISQAYVETAPSDPKTILIVPAAVLTGLFFGCVLVLLSAFQRMVMKHPTKD